MDCHQDSSSNQRGMFSEKVTGLMSVFADDFRNVATLKAGSIGLVSGLKATMTGDTLVESENAFATATSLAMTSSTDDDASKDHFLKTLRRTTKSFNLFSYRFTNYILLVNGVVFFEDLSIFVERVQVLVREIGQVENFKLVIL